MSAVTGKEALMQILRAEGVQYVFGIPGATEAQFVDVMEDHPEIEYVLTMHELTAVGMAEGYARASGKVGFLNLHTGTGLAAGMPLLSNAYWGGVPLVVTVGQQDTRILAEEAAMSDDLVKIAAPFTKWATEVMRPEDLPTVMRRAFKIATHPPTGPVMVSLPLDVLANTFDFEYQPSAHSYTRLHPDDRSVAAAVELLLGAQNPAIIVEDGVTKCEALDEMVRFAEQIGAPVYQPWMADVNFPVHHPLYLGDLDPNTIATRDIFERVDVLVVVGAMFFMQAIPTAKPLVPAATKVIQIDDNPWQIAKNFPVACGVEGDIKVALSDLGAALEARLRAETGLAAGGADSDSSSGAGAGGAFREAVAERTKKIAGQRRKMVEAFEEKVLAEWDNNPISGTRVMAELRDAVLPGTRIVDDCWSYSAILRRMLPLTELREYQRARTGGAIGGGLPMALGVKLASPDRPVVCVSGDGSAMWSIQSLWNATHYDLPVTFIILSNRAYRQVRIMKTKLLGEGVKGRNLGTVLSPPEVDFCSIAAGFGLAARKVTNPGELRAALREALGSGVPNLVDIVVDPSF
jgi:benzoylformate decarboxylase